MRVVITGSVVVALLLASGATALAAETPSANAAAGGDVAAEVRNRYAADPSTLGRPGASPVVVVPVSASREMTSAPYHYVGQPPPQPMPGPYGPPPGYG